MSTAGSHPNTRAVAAAAAELDVHIEVVEYPAGTRTAVDAARAIGCSVGQIVKSLVFAVDPDGSGPAAGSRPADGPGERDELVLALVSGSNQLDEVALGRAAGSGPARRVDAEAVREATGFSIGGVPPFGHHRRLRTFVDADLLGYEEIWAAAGTPTSVFRLTPAELQRLSGATVTELRR